jgi:hypothetical protein
MSTKTAVKSEEDYATGPSFHHPTPVTLTTCCCSATELCRGSSPTLQFGLGHELALEDRMRYNRQSSSSKPRSREVFLIPPVQQPLGPEENDRHMDKAQLF